MAIRLTESRLRQIIREEAANLTRRPTSRRTRRLRESTDPMFQEYLRTIEIRAEEDEFFAGSPVESVAKNIVEDTLAYDFDDVNMTPGLVDGLTQALLKKHRELSGEGYEGLGGGASNF